MKLSSMQTDEKSLADFGAEASEMLARLDYSGLANRFGYALSYGRETATAIEADYLEAVASPHKIELCKRPSVAVKYFEANSTFLFALVECLVPVQEGAAVLLELVVTGQGDDKHITVEDISGVTRQAPHLPQPMQAIKLA